jgi:hypothetical protein
MHDQHERAQGQDFTQGITGQEEKAVARINLKSDLELLVAVIINIPIPGYAGFKPSYYIKIQGITLVGEHSSVDVD